MSKIPTALLKDLLADPVYKTCLRQVLLQDHECQGRITFEHALIYAGKQIQKKWAIIPICAYAHSVYPYQESGILKKEINEWIAFNRATDAELAEFERATPPYSRRREYLNTIYKKKP